MGGVGPGVGVARAAVLLKACAPASEWGGCPGAVPVQVHGMDADRIFAEEATSTRPAAATQQVLDRVLSRLART